VAGNAVSGKIFGQAFLKAWKRSLEEEKRKEKKKKKEEV
jgi:hypothetical protein